MLTHQDEINELKEKVRQLEEMLVPMSTLVPIGWGLTKIEARMVACLLGSPDGARSKEALTFSIWGWGREPDDLVTNLRVRVRMLREKLRPHGVVIEKIQGFGYRINKSKLKGM